MNASEPIRRNARLAPGAIAILRSDGSELTNAALDATLDALALRLRELGLAPGHAVAVGTADPHRYLLLLLALARIGVTAAPGNLPPALAELVLTDYAADRVNHARVIAIDEVWPAAASASPPPAPMHEDGEAILVLSPSSGTTSGAPKFCPVSHDLMARRVALRVANPPLAAGSRHACLVNPYAGYGLVSVLRTLWMGCTMVEPDLRSAELAAWLAGSRVSHISTSPIGLARLLDALPAQPVACDLRTIEIGGGVLPTATYELAQRRLPAMVIATYGSTETGNVATAPFAVVTTHPDAAGYVLPGVTVEIVDDEDRPLPPGAEGIVRVRGGGTASGYRGNDPAAARVFRDGWVYPNDRGILEADGLLRVTGRTDDVIVVDGVKINPRTIEDALLSLADLREAAVFGAHDAAGATVICAAVVPNGALDGAAFHARCREALGARAPALVMQMHALPRNAMGKVQRAELARMAIEADRARTSANPG